MQDFYVYIHRKKSTGEVFYIGKGSGMRAWDMEGRNRHWSFIVNKHGHDVEVFSSGLQEWYAMELESDLIAYYGRRDAGYGNLCNMTDGGEGFKGGFLPSHVKEQKSQIWKENNPNQNEQTNAVRLDRLRRSCATYEARSKKMGDKNPMRRPDVSAKLKGENNGYSVKVYCKELDMVFGSMADAVRYVYDNFGVVVGRKCIGNTCRGLQKTARGYTWSYA